MVFSLISECWPYFARMSVVNQTAKRDVTVSKDALLKSYSKRLKDDVRSLADNFSSIVKTCRYSKTPAWQRHSFWFNQEVTGQ